MSHVLPPHILFGAAYYLEYQQRPDLFQDLEWMSEASFSLIRVGESVWSTWEPEDGRFELDWMQPILDEAHRRKISVILGTPTYAVPMWLPRKYPEIAAERATGQRIGWGARQEVDYTHPAFRFHAERVIRAIMARFADHPAIIGFQVDNEPGNELFHNHGVFERFKDQLRHEYGSVEALNREWGLTYWSHRLSTWDDLWTPDNNAQPQYDLAWRRFQASLTTEMIDWQRRIVREYASQEQFITTCMAYDRPALEDDALGAVLDVTSGNAYYRMQDHLALPDRASADTVQKWFTTGTWSVYRTADRMWGSRQEPFLVTETNASAIWGASLNEPPYQGQLAQAAWALISRGARAIEYWHWHTLPYGTETYWGGVLPHSNRPGRIYSEVSSLGRQIRHAGADVTGLTPQADIGVIHSNDSKWALAFQSPFGNTEPDERAYERIVDAWYRGAFDARRQTRFIAPGQLFTQDPVTTVDDLPVLIAAGLYITTESQLEWLRRYAEAGGHLIIGIRTGYADDEARPRSDAQPGGLATAAGVSYDEYSTLPAPVPALGGEELLLPEGTFAERWIDGLVPAEGTTVLASYAHPHFSAHPLATTKSVGDGRITTVGTHPDARLAAAILGWAVPQGSGLADRWISAIDAAGRESVTVTGAAAPDGRVVRFVHNWSWEPARITLPVAVEDLLAEPLDGGTRPRIEAGEELPLGAWDVRVLREVSTS